MLLAKAHEDVKSNMKQLMAAKGKEHKDQLAQARALATAKQSAKEVAAALR
jgi:hypothetical protein